jgi:hypothetical protein
MGKRVELAFRETEIVIGVKTVAMMKSLKAANYPLGLWDE